MTDEEIIQHIECCAKTDCFNCNFDCDANLMESALDLINRQQAEIERLKEENDKNFEKWEILDKRTKERYAELYEEAKGVVRAEAVKEFGVAEQCRAEEQPQTVYEYVDEGSKTATDEKAIKAAAYDVITIQMAMYPDSSTDTMMRFIQGVQALAEILCGEVE